MRHKTELAANATIASAVSVRIRVFETTALSKQHTDTTFATKTAGF
jgi:hypothetical protein